MCIFADENELKVTDMKKQLYLVGIVLGVLLAHAACSSGDGVSEVPNNSDKKDSILIDNDSDIFIPTDGSWMEQVVGSTWKLQGFGSFGNDEIRKAKPEDCETCYVITFNEDGKISGTTSTNELMGEYTISVDSLAFNPLGGTKVGEIGDGKEFFQALEACKHYAISGSQLLLYYNRNKNYLLFNNVID